MTQIRIDTRLWKAGIALAALLVVWSGAGLFLLAGRSAPRHQAQGLVQRLERLQGALLGELQRQAQETDGRVSGAGPERRSERLLATWEQESGGLEDAAAAFPQAAERIRSAADWMRRANAVRPAPEVRAWAGLAMVDLQSALSQLRNPPEEVLADERRGQAWVLGGTMLLASLILLLLLSLGAVPPPAVKVPARVQFPAETINMIPEDLARSRKLAEQTAVLLERPLTIINGYSDLLLDTVAVNDANRPDLEEIRRAGEEVADVVRSLQTYSAGESQARKASGAVSRG